MLKVYNYSCNEEIDKKACCMEWDDEKNIFKVDKHKIPTLKDIVEELGYNLNENEDKQRLLSHLRYFLHKGQKKFTEADLEKTYCPEATEGYSLLLKEIINNEGEYTDEAKKFLKSKFEYHKCFDLKQKPEVLTHLLTIFHKELKEMADNEHYIEEIENIAFFLKNKQIETKEYKAEKWKYLIDFFKDENITLNINVKEIDGVNKEYSKIDGSKKAWFSKIEKVYLPHYHVPKVGKNPINEYEKSFYVATLDLVTEDTLYYVCTTVYYDLPGATLYLNMLNQDLNKPNLCILHLNAPFLEEIKVVRWDEKQLKKAIEICKHSKEEFINFCNNNVIRKDASYYNFYPSYYLASLYIHEVLEGLDIKKLFGIDLNVFLKKKMPCFYYSNVKEFKKEVLTILITSIILINKIYCSHDVQTALLFMYTKLQDCINDDNAVSLLKNLLVDEDELQKAITEIKKDVSLFSTILKETNFINALSHNYADVHLKLRLQPKQKEALQEYLNVNLTSIKDPEENKNYPQILDFRGKKHNKNIIGEEVDIFKYYKKENGYYGCIDAEEYKICQILDVSILDIENDFLKIFKKTYVLWVEVLDVETLKTELWTLYKYITPNSATKEEEKKVKDFIKNQNQIMTLFFDTFSIRRGNFNLETWKGKTAKIGVYTEKLKVDGQPVFKSAEGKGVLHTGIVGTDN